MEKNDPFLSGKTLICLQYRVLWEWVCGWVSNDILADVFVDPGGVSNGVDFLLTNMNVNLWIWFERRT